MANQRPTFVFLTCLLVAIVGARRVDMQKMEQMEADSEPDWCTDIPNKKKCTGVQKIQCPVTCGLEELEDEPDETPQVEQPKLVQIFSVTRETTPAKLTTVMKTSVYKKMWPTNCDRTNEKGESIAGLSTDGFKCSPSRGGAIEHIIAKGYSSYICKDSKCVDAGRVDIQPLEFWEAAGVLARAYAFKNQLIQNDAGTDVAIKVIQNDPSAVQETGVLASVDVRMPAADLKFINASPNLTEKGEQFFADLAEPLGAFVSLQITGYPGKNLKVLFCAHSSTTARKDNIRAGLEFLPLERAVTVKEELAGRLPSEDVASLGEAIGHFDSEVPGYVGDRVAHIIYKIYDPAVAIPQCMPSDLYPFVGKEMFVVSEPVEEGVGVLGGDV